MASIELTRTESEESYQFQVTVREAQSLTRHQVTLGKSYYQRLTAGKATPEGLMRESFRFLLEREPKEMILRSFDLTVIGRYFPEFERQIKRRL